MRKSGVEHIKEELFSHNGNVGRVKFFITSLITLPSMCISILLIWDVVIKGVYKVIEEYSTWGYIHSSQYDNIAVIFMFFMISSIVLPISFLVFISFLVRRLNDINLDRSKGWFLLLPIINVLFLFVLFITKGVKDE